MNNASHVRRMCKQIAHRIGCKPAYIEFNDQPFMRLVAEWEQWPGLKRVSLGYTHTVNDDVCYDPLVIVDLTANTVSARVVNSLAGTCIPDNDLVFTAEFLDTVLERHRDRFLAEGGDE